MKSILFSLLCSLPLSALAAPHPATSSSSLIAADKGMYWSKMGFALNAGQSRWLHSEPPKSSEQVATIYRSPRSAEGNLGSLTVRTEILQANRQLKAEFKNWLKDFRRLGFDVMSTKQIKVSGQPAYMLDLYHADSEKQLRQVVFNKDRRLVVLTCRDSKANFSESVKACNEITKTFRWTR